MEKQESRQNGDSLDETPEERDARREREADIAKYRAEKELVDAQRCLEKQRERAAKAERRAMRSNRREVLPMKAKLIMGAACAAVVVVAVVFGIPAYQASQNKTTYFTSSQLSKIVNINKLSTATYRHSGIADKYNDKGEVEYHVYYESTVDASYDMGAIDFEIDNDAKTIKPILPEPTIGDPNIDTASIDYLPKDPNASIRDVETICKEDARAEAKSAGGILYTAHENMKRIIDALLKPIVSEDGYEIIWSEEDANFQSANGWQESSQENGGSNE